MMIVCADFTFGVLFGALIVAVVLGYYLSNFYVNEVRKLLDKLVCESCVDDDNMMALEREKQVLDKKNTDLMDDNFGLESEVEWCMSIIKSKNRLIEGLENDILNLKKDNERLYGNNQKLVGRLLEKN